MKCIECGSTMTKSVENHKYESLPGVTLWRCANCGEHEIVIEDLEGLNRFVALVLVKKPARLSGPEVRFLRKSMGWSQSDFANKMGVDKSTVSRWEQPDGEAIGNASDRLLRLMVVHEPAD